MKLYKTHFDPYCGSKISRALLVIVSILKAAMMFSSCQGKPALLLHYGTPLRALRNQRACFIDRGSPTIVSFIKK